MANTRDTLGERATLDALVADTLTSLEEDGCVKVGSYALYNRNELTSVTLPNVEVVNQRCMSNCSKLETIDIDGSRTIGSSAMSSSKSVASLILRGNARGTILATSLSNTKVERRRGAVYVPTSLVSSYKSDSTWAKYFIADIADYPLSDYSTIADSWSTIVSNCAAGTVDSYSIGDTKSIEIDGDLYYVQLVAKNSDVLDSDGTTAVSTTWITDRHVYALHAMNSTSTSSGGWGNSEMRSWLSSTVLPLLPAEVQAGIKAVRKYSSTYENGAIVKDGSVTSDKLWIPSCREVSLSSTYSELGPIYSTDIYPSGTTSAAKSARVKFNTAGDTTSWYLRDVTTSNSFASVGTSGSQGATSAANKQGVVLGFCI